MKNILKDFLILPRVFFFFSIFQLLLLLICDYLLILFSYMPKSASPINEYLAPIEAGGVRASKREALVLWLVMGNTALGASVV